MVELRVRPEKLGLGCRWQGKVAQKCKNLQRVKLLQQQQQQPTSQKPPGGSPKQVPLLGVLLSLQESPKK